MGRKLRLIGACFGMMLALSVVNAGGGSATPGEAVDHVLDAPFVCYEQISGSPYGPIGGAYGCAGWLANTPYHLLNDWP